MKEAKAFPSTGMKLMEKQINILKIVGLEESSRTLIKDIGVGKQQLVEIAKALAKKCKTSYSG